MATVNPRSVKKISRPARNVNLVVCAMRNLGDENGSTVGNIVRYLSECCEKPAPKRELIAALKRGIEFGIVDRRRGRYFLGENEKHFGHLSRYGNGSSITAPKHRRGGRPIGGTNTHIGGGNSTSTELLERDARARKVGKTRKERKSKDGTRRKKSSKKHTGRKSLRKARFARSLKSYDLTDYYHNPTYKASAISSIDSLDYYQREH